MIPYEKRLHLANKQLESANRKADETLKAVRRLKQLAEAFRVFNEVKLKELYSQVNQEDVLVGIVQEVEKL